MLTMDFYNKYINMTAHNIMSDFYEHACHYRNLHVPFLWHEVMSENSLA